MEKEKGKYSAQEKWQAANMDKIQLKSLKQDRIPERVQTQVEAGKAASKAAYIIEAIKQRLEADEAAE